MNLTIWKYRKLSLTLLFRPININTKYRLLNVTTLYLFKENTISKKTLFLEVFFNSQICNFTPIKCISLFSFENNLQSYFRIYEVNYTTADLFETNNGNHTLLSPFFPLCSSHLIPLHKFTLGHICLSFSLSSESVLFCTDSFDIFLLYIRLVFFFIYFLMWIRKIIESTVGLFIKNDKSFLWPCEMQHSALCVSFHFRHLNIIQMYY